MKHILQLLDRQCELHPDKTAFSDGESEYTWSETRVVSQKIGTALLDCGAEKKSVLILLDKNASCVLSMFGCLEANAFYTILDSAQPVDRMREITSQLDSTAIITNDQYRGIASELAPKVFLWDELLNVRINNNALLGARNRAIDTNLAYVLFTSGSTGKPKGVAITHRNVLSYSEWFVKTFNINAASLTDIEK